MSYAPAAITEGKTAYGFEWFKNISMRDDIKLNS
jgi:hypothetical protein